MIINKLRCTKKRADKKNKKKKKKEEIASQALPNNASEFAARMNSIVKDADSQEPAAVFLNDQVNNRFAKKPGYRWSEETIKY